MLISFPKKPSSFAALITLIKSSPWPKIMAVKNRPIAFAIRPTKAPIKISFLII